MAKKSINLRDELHSYKFAFDLLQRIPCSKEENKEYKAILKNGGSLPEGVFPYVYEGGEEPNGEFYTIYETDLTQAELDEYIAYKQLYMIRTIKNCVVFFTVLAVISLIIAFFMIMSAM